MAALLVSLAVMAVLMSVAMPVWRHEAQREKEAELVFRGQQYVRAIRLFQMKTGTFPTSVDLLVQGHYLRKKFKDPITGQEFEYVGAAGSPGQPGGTGQPGQTGRGTPVPAPGRGQTPAGGSGAGAGSGTTGGGAVSGGTIPGGMMGVRSKSKDESIRLYLGRNHYNEWMFVFAGQQQQPGGAGTRSTGRSGWPRRPRSARPGWSSGTPRRQRPRSRRAAASTAGIPRSRPSVATSFDLRTPLDSWQFAVCGLQLGSQFWSSRFGSELRTTPNVKQQTELPTLNRKPNCQL